MYPRRTHFFAFVLLLTLSVVVQADKVDDYVRAQMEKQHIPGMSLVVIKDQKIIKSEGYGLANVELKVPAKPDTVYKIGSVSKQFLAAGIMLLVQDGKVSLDDNVGKFLEGTPDTWKPITVRHLLTHTSGIVREAPGFDPLKIQNDADVIKTAYSLPLRFAPGEKYEYCNVGYFTLAEIIRKVSGKPWGDFLNERVFAPLEMNSTRTTNITELVPNRANGYVWRNDKLQNAGIHFALRPSGAFLSTILDLAKWDAALQTGKILKQSTLEQMWTPVKLNNGTTEPYGFGWQLESVSGHKQVNHGGSLPGFRAQLARFVDDKLTVAVLTNGDNANAAAIAIGVANFYIPGLIPVRIVAKVDPNIFDGYVGQYQPSPSVIVSVTREGDKLIMQQGPGEKRELSPESETNFFIKDSPRSIYSFIKDETGQAYLGRMNLLKHCPVVIETPVIKFEGREVWRAKKIKVAWGQMDAFRHLNNTAYFRFFESARIAYFERLNLLQYMEATGVGPILAATNCKFRIPLTYPDTVSIGTRISDIEDDRFTMEYYIVSHQHQKVAAEGTGLIVCFDYKQNKKALVPAELKQRIRELEASI